MAASLLAGFAWASPALAESPIRPPVDFFFDLVGDRLVDTEPPDGEARGPARIAGVPLTIDAREGDRQADRRMTAGAKGRYSLNIANTVNVVGQAQVAGTEFGDEHTPGRAAASAGADFSYARCGWKFGLKPGFEILREGTGFGQRDSLVEGRLSKAIAPGLSMAGTARYRWRESLTQDVPDREIATARIGFASRLPHDSRMDLAYVGRQEVVNVGLQYGGPEVIQGYGPSIAFAVPLQHDLDLSANYDFTGQTSHAPSANGQPGWRTEDELHRLNLALTWALGGDPDAMQLSAAYRYERGGPDPSLPDERHAGAVTLAVFF